MKSFAKLKLKNIVEQEDVKEALEFFNAVIYQYTESTVFIPDDPKNMTITVFIDILKNSSFAYSLEELAKEACRKNEYVKSYILADNKNNNNHDKLLKIENNRKLRNIYEFLLENSHIVKTQERPITLQWIKDKILLSDLSDASDTYKNKIEESDNKDDEKAIKTISYVSDSNPVGPKDGKTENKGLISDDKMILEILKSEPMMGYKKPFYYCKEHINVEFIDYNEMLDHIKYSRVHRQPT